MRRSTTYFAGDLLLGVFLATLVVIAAAALFILAVAAANGDLSETHTVVVPRCVR